MPPRGPKFDPSIAKGLESNLVPSGYLFLATIMDVDPQNKTCIIVNSESESPPIKDVPWTSSAASTFSAAGLNVIPTRGCLAVTACLANFYYVIIGFIREPIEEGIFNSDFKDKKYEHAFEDAPRYKDVQEFITGAKTELYNNSQRRFWMNFAGLTPIDLHLGDSELAGNDGGSIGVYRGGMARIKVSNLTQMIFFKFRNLIRTITRRWEMWMDNYTILFDSDSMSAKAGASFIDETHPDIDKWRIRYRTGSGPHLMSLIVTPPLKDTPIPPEEIIPGEEPDYFTEIEQILYNNYILPDGNRDEFSKENIDKVARLKITELSLEDNIEEEAEVDILEWAHHNIQEKADNDIIETADNNITTYAEVNIDRTANTGDITRTANQGNIADTAPLGNVSTEAPLGDISELGTSITETASAGITSTAGGQYNITGTGGINALSPVAINLIGGGGVNLLSSAISLAAPSIIVGGTLLPPSGSGTVPNSGGINGLLFSMIYNTHTHLYTAPSGQASSTSPPEAQYALTSAQMSQIPMG